MQGREAMHALRLHDAPLFHLDLHTMIDAIRSLYHHVFHEGLQRRLRSHHQDNREIEFPSIAEALDAYIAPTYTAPLVRPAGADAQPVDQRARRGDAAKTQAPPTAEPSWLARHFVASKRFNIHHHDLGERLRSSANQHLTRAMCLTRRSYRDAANVHIRLAESAINEARHYLPQDDFRAMKLDFEEKLATLVQESAPSQH